MTAQTGRALRCACVPGASGAFFVQIRLCVGVLTVKLFMQPPCVCVLCLRVFVVYSHADFLKRKEGKPRAHQGGLPRATRGQFVVFFFFLLL